VAARQIALALKHPEKEELFIAALLHDIGKLVLMLKLPDRYTEIVAEVERDGCPFVEIEERVLGFTHCDVAAVLLEKWSFPGTLIEAVFGHHLLPDAPDGGPVPPAYVIHLGNIMAKQLGNGFAEPAVDDLTALPSARALGLDENRLEDIRDKFQEQYQSEIGVFEGS
jgi:HD-like signal output (HDOD) protein